MANIWLKSQKSQRSRTAIRLKMKGECVLKTKAKNSKPPQNIIIVMELFKP